MSYSSRFWLYAPLLLLLALAAWVGGHWWNAAGALDRKLDALRGHDAIPGIVIDWRGKTVSGFPFRLDVVFTGFSLKGTGAHGPLAWTSEEFALHALTYGRDQQIFEAGGQQALLLTGADGVAHNLSFLPAALHASAISDARGLARFDLDILDAGGKDGEGKKFIAGRLQLHFRRDPAKGGLDIAASADALSSAGAKPRSFAVSETLDHGEAFAALLRGGISWPQADAAWRRAGGQATGVSPSADPAAPLLSLLY